MTPCTPTSINLSISLSLCLSLYPNSPSQKGSQKRGGPGVPGIYISRCSLGPRRPPGGLTPRTGTCSCCPSFLLLTRAHLEGQRTKDGEGGDGPGRQRFGAYLCLFPARGSGVNCSPPDSLFPLLSRAGATADFAKAGVRDDRTGSQGHRTTPLQEALCAVLGQQCWGP